MFQKMTADEAIRMINDGDCICVNAFVGIENCTELHEAIYRRYKASGSPTHLTLISASGFGPWDEDSNAESYIREGAMDRLICGHFGAMLSTKKLVLEDRFEAYNLPLGDIARSIRAQASGLPGALSKVGLGIFVDPRIEGPGINSISNDTSFARVVELDGEEYMLYSLPQINVALIKATAVDPKGNISFEDEYVIGDALSIAQAAKRNNGKVIVQVDRVNDKPVNPVSAVIPGCLVDAVVVAPPEPRDEAFESLTGKFDIPSSELQGWLDRLNALTSKGKKSNVPGDIIGRRASKELKSGDIVNIGIGLPENVSKFAQETGMFDEITLTVESGATTGLPASGTVFGSMIGAGSVYAQAQQFDFYNGGGLDICFMGGLEVDRFGNVNAHRGPGAYSGVGGFANITSNTPEVVFCLTFNTKGLQVSEENGTVTIEQEGSIGKFVPEVASISFSGQKAMERGQRVLYVTERCVFQLTPEGMKLVEVYPGIDAEKDIISQLPFEVIR